MSTSMELTAIEHTIDGRPAPWTSESAPINVSVGTHVTFRVQATGQGNVGFAVGTDTLALAEWNDTRHFEFHIPGNFAGKTLQIHVGIRARTSSGNQMSTWLGPVDDLQCYRYQVAEENER
jgi:hypothetical protein